MKHIHVSMMLTEQVLDSYLLRVFSGKLLIKKTCKVVYFPIINLKKPWTLQMLKDFSMATANGKSRLRFYKAKRKILVKEKTPEFYTDGQVQKELDKTSTQQNIFQGLRKEVATMNFSNVGAAWNSKSQKGTEYISIRLDLDKFSSLATSDYKKICMFANKYKKEEQQPDYVVMAPLPEETV